MNHAVGQSLNDFPHQQRLPHDADINDPQLEKNLKLLRNNFDWSVAHLRSALELICRFNPHAVFVTDTSAHPIGAILAEFQQRTEGRDLLHGQMPHGRDSFPLFRVDPVMNGQHYLEMPELEGWPPFDAFVMRLQHAWNKDRALLPCPMAPAEPKKGWFSKLLRMGESSDVEAMRESKRVLIFDEYIVTMPSHLRVGPNDRVYVMEQITRMVTEAARVTHHNICAAICCIPFSIAHGEDEFLGTNMELPIQRRRLPSHPCYESSVDKGLPTYRNAPIGVTGIVPDHKPEYMKEAEPADRIDRYRRFIGRVVDDLIQRYGELPTTVAQHHERQMRAGALSEPHGKYWNIPPRGGLIIANAS